MATTTITKKQEIYSDFRANLDPHPVKRDLVRLTNEDAVVRSVRNILLTEPYERYGKPYFGAGLKAYLFELVTPVTAAQIKSAIELSINNYEPRANLIGTQVVVNPDNNSYTATVVFSVTTRIDPVRLTLLLKRVR